MMVVNLKKLIDIVNPLKNPPWKEISSEIFPEEIFSAKSSVDTEEYDCLKPQTRKQHIEKIAFFVKNGWKDDPITIVFNKDLYPIYDGNHRLCAAIIRNDDFILANVEGDRKKIKEIAY